MAVIRIKRTFYDAMDDDPKKALRWGVKGLALGEPAIYKTGNVEWCVFSDWRANVDEWKAMLREHGTPANINVIDALPPAWEPVESEVPDV